MPQLLLNGVNASTGAYLSGPKTVEDLVKVLTERGNLSYLSSKHYEFLIERDKWTRKVHWDIAPHLSAEKLEQAGWGVIFPHDVDPAIVAALRPLLDHRRAQAGKYYFEFTAHKGHRPKDTKEEFLKRLGVARGHPADPEKGVPYYLLLVGDPRRVPYRFQYELDVEYAVGRLCFDTPKEYENYANSVVLAETKANPLPRRAAFVGVRNDPATALSADYLIKPLAAKMHTDFPAWKIDEYLAAQAHKQTIKDLLGGKSTPALLFTASHGVGFDNGDPRQIKDQGALLCQEWQPSSKPVAPEVYFSADDVANDAGLIGLISVHFACYGAGTPDVDDFPGADFKFGAKQIAPYPFAARLAQRLLGHPAGGALAFVGHVDRAWSCSFMLDGQSEAIGTFRAVMNKLMSGNSIGTAVEWFNKRYAALATSLTTRYQNLAFGMKLDTAGESSLASDWLDHNDARNFILFGDPAVKMKVAEQGGPRPNLGASYGSSVPPSTPPPMVPTPPATTTVPIPFDAGQLTATESRYKQLQDAIPSSFTVAGPGDLLRRNSPDLLRKRLLRLGFPAEQVEEVVRRILAGGALPFATISSGETARLPIGLERILGRNDLLPVRYLARGTQVSRAVGRVVLRGSQRGYGTGFLVSPRLLMTNNHVFESAADASPSYVEFNYEDALDGSAVNVLRVDLDPAAFFLTSRELDCTLVAVRPRSDRSLGELGAVSLASGEGQILIGENVSIIQHPNGNPKRVALRENTVIGISQESFLHYRTDTAPGSSGSPVFNDQFELVALHHSGVPKRGPGGVILRKDGNPWREGDGEDAIDWIANEGVLVAALRSWIQGQAFSGTQRELVQELLDASPRPPSLPPSEERTTTPVSPVPTSGSSSGGEITTSVPLHITVQLGAVRGQTSTRAQVSSPTESAQRRFVR